MDVAEPLAVPTSPHKPARPPLPLVAALVPVIAGLTLWAVTGSLLSLAFAALGPLMMFGSLLDGARGRRGAYRAAVQAAEQEWDDAEAALVQAHAALRARARREHPTLREQTAGAILGDEDLSVRTRIVVGVGERPSGLRVTGGDDARAEEFRARAARVAGMPVTVELGRGVALRGPAALTAPVARALLASLALRCAPAQLALVGEGVAVLGAGVLPHAQGGRAAVRVEVAMGAPTGGADAAICVLDARDDAPPGLSTVIDCADPRRAGVRTTQESQTVALDGLSADQLAALAAHWPGWSVADVPDSLAWAELEPGGGAGLTATIGRGAGGPIAVDLLGDGPHAIVTGMTGTGKSELLITWVLALAAAYAPDEVTFVLADFKGGTAFEALRPLPHVAAIVTDLDEEGARRGVQSLRAELRRRERALALAGAREIGETELARLVIVVDEFAALLAEHPDLADVFTDIAARGRALGMHLILGTQRAAGVIRDSLAANCPLRISLRVADPADSRAVVGSAEAAELPGDARGRGLAMIRRPADDHAHRTRLALSSAADIAGVAERWAGHARARSPWLPALPLTLAAGDVAVPAGEILLGLGDEPAEQRQLPVTLVPGVDRGMMIVGGPGSGKSTVLALAARHAVPHQRLEPDAEAAWDLVSGEDALAPLVLGDDLDAVMAQFPPDYAAAFAERLEMLVRRAAVAGSCVVLTASRVTGGLARIADLLPRRALLALPSRAEHLAAGGSAEGYRAGRPPGRAVINGVEAQFALAPLRERHREPVTAVWEPAPGVTAVITPQPEAWAARLAARHPGLRVQGPGEWSDDAQGPVAVVADGDTWQRHWALWQQLRGEVLVAAEAASELRTLAGVRELPPYARTHAGRAWLLRGGGRPKRVVLGD